MLVMKKGERKSITTISFPSLPIGPKSTSKLEWILSRIRQDKARPFRIQSYVKNAFSLNWMPSEFILFVYFLKWFFASSFLFFLTQIFLLKNVFSWNPLDTRDEKHQIEGNNRKSVGHIKLQSSFFFSLLFFIENLVKWTLRSSGMKCYDVMELIFISVGDSFLC